MTSRGAAIVAFGAISGLGVGEQAASAGTPGARPVSAIARDLELADAGLARPFAARASLPVVDDDDRATALLSFALDACARELDRERPGWRAARVALCVGTSSGGMRSAERLFRGEPIDPLAATYFGPLHAALARAGLTCEPAALLLGACASGSLAIGLGARWIEEGRADLVLAGGFDSVSVFVAAGFEALRATTASPPPRPFRIGRDGMALGEGAAILALAPAPDMGHTRARAYVAGFAASCDAVHVTAPDRTGAGLARAATAALIDAGLAPQSVDLIGAHATGTPYNDAAEARALAAALGPRARDVPVSPFKAQIGHALGAAGALEALACVDALARGVLPGAVGEGPLDEDAPARLLREAERGAPQVALKLASAFGGANAALVLARAPPLRETYAARSPRAAYVSRAVHVVAPTTALAARIPAPTLARADALVRLALSAVVELEAAVGPLAGSGIVVGHALATLETNALFYAKIAAHGARAAEPRRFPYTSPNAACGECAVHLGLTGPAFAVGGGLHGALEALALARDLVAAGDADRLVVVAVDDVGPASARMGHLADGLTSGAVALLVSASAGGAVARVGPIRIALGPAAPSAAAPRAGHAALLPLATDPIRLPICLSASARGSFAEVTLIGVNAES